LKRDLNSEIRHVYGALQVIDVARGAVGALVPPPRAEKKKLGVIYREICKCTPQHTKCTPERARGHFWWAEEILRFI